MVSMSGLCMSDESNVQRTLKDKLLCERVSLGLSKGMMEEVDCCLVLWKEKRKKEKLNGKDDGFYVF